MFHTLFWAYKYVFTLPSSVNKICKAKWLDNAWIHGMTSVTLASITYVATQVRNFSSLVYIQFHATFARFTLLWAHQQCSHVQTQQLIWNIFTIVLLKFLKNQMSNMKLMTFLYVGISKDSHWVADDFSNAGNFLVRYSLNIHPQSDQHQRTAHRPISRSTVSARREKYLLLLRPTVHLWALLSVVDCSGWEHIPYSIYCFMYTNLILSTTLTMSLNFAWVKHGGGSEIYDKVNVYILSQLPISVWTCTQIYSMFICSIHFILAVPVNWYHADQSGSNGPSL